MFSVITIYISLETLASLQVVISLDVLSKPRGNEGLNS